MNRAFSIAAVLLITASEAGAYDTDTHAWLMYQGYLKSSLATSAPLRERLGFERLDDATPFRVHSELVTLGNRDAYLDLVPGSSFGVITDPYTTPTAYRPPNEYERQSFVYTGGPAAPGSNSGLYPTPF